MHNFFFFLPKLYFTEHTSNCALRRPCTFILGPAPGWPGPAGRSSANFIQPFWMEGGIGPPGQVSQQEEEENKVDLGLEPTVLQDGGNEILKDEENCHR